TPRRIQLHEGEWCYMTDYCPRRSIACRKLRFGSHRAKVDPLDKSRQYPGPGSAVAEATPHSGGRPLRAGAYHSNPRPIRAIDQRVRTDFVLDVGDVDLRRRQPLQCRRYVAGPDAPRRTISDLHDMTPVVLLDLHRRSPCVIDPSLDRCGAQEEPGAA